MFTEVQWMDRQESICEDYAAGALSLEEAMNALTRIGLDVWEASALLTEYEL